MNFREYILKSGNTIFLGKDAESNDELVKKYKGKRNIILHTVKPGSPFCVLEELDSSEKEIHEAAVICASRSQDWRDNKSNVQIHQFSGTEVRKPLVKKIGTWRIKGTPKVIKVKKEEIKKWSSEQSN